MTGIAIPSTRFRLMLLSAAAVALCIQLKITVTCAEGAIVQQHEDKPSPTLSRFKEERMNPLPPGLIDNLPSLPSKVSLIKNLKSLYQGGKTAISSLTMMASPRYFLSHATNKAEAVKDLFQYFSVGDVTYNLFGSSKYKQWSGIILSVYPDAPSEAHKLIFSQLLAHFKNDLIGHLILARRSDYLQDIGELYENMLVDSWIVESKHKLSDLVQNLSLQSWYKASPDSGVILRLRLQVNGVDDLDSMVQVVASEDGAAAVIMSDFLLVKSYEVEYRRLKLHRVDSNKGLLKSPIFKEWVDFVVADRTVNFGDALLSTLRKRTVRDCELLDALFDLGDSGEMYRIAVEDSLINEWTRQNRDIKEVYFSLGLDNYNGEAHHGRVRAILDAYLDKRGSTGMDARILTFLLLKYNMTRVDEVLKDPWLQKWLSFKRRAEMDAAINDLPVWLELNHVGDDLYHMSAAANEDATLIAADLQISAWKKNGQKPHEVFRELEGDIDSLLANPVLSTLYRYVDNEKEFGKSLLNCARGTSNGSLFSAWYGSDKMSWLVPILENALLNKWRELHYDAIQLFKHLSYEVISVEAHVKPTFLLWMNYLELTTKASQI